MENKKMNNKGFSLVELIIVIAIMAILVGALAPQFIKYVESSRQSTDIQNSSAIRSAIEAGVADETIKSTGAGSVVTVKTSNPKGSIVVSGTNVSGLDDALSTVGLSANTVCKSSGWKADKTIGTYTLATYKWAPGTDTDTENDNNPKKKLNESFK